MKKTDVNTTKSFYYGETTLETMQSNLIVPFSESLNNAYKTTNSLYSYLGNAEHRESFFYDQYKEEFKNLMIDYYGGSSVGSPYVPDATDKALLVKNMIHNLTFVDVPHTIAPHDSETPDGIPLANIYCNDGTITWYNDSGISEALTGDYSTKPSEFIEKMARPNPANGAMNYFGSDGIYVVIPNDFSLCSTTDDVFNSFVTLSLTKPDGSLLPANERRLLLKNVCVVVVNNGYRSVITTDIAFQFPPIYWSDTNTASEYSEYDVYQLVYYVNWSRS